MFLVANLGHQCRRSTPRHEQRIATVPGGWLFAAAAHRVLRTAAALHFKGGQGTLAGLDVNLTS